MFRYICELIDKGVVSFEEKGNLSMTENESAQVKGISSDFIVRVVISLALGLICTLLFKIYIYDAYISLLKYPDFGPSLHKGIKPDELTYLYVVFVATSTLIGFLMTWNICNRVELLKNRSYLAFLMIILLIGVSVISSSFLGHKYATQYTYSILRLLLFSLISLIIISVVIQHPRIKPILKLLPKLSSRLFVFLFSIIVLFHLPKLYVLHAMFRESGMAYPAAALFLGFSFLAALLGMVITRGRSYFEQFVVTLFLIMVYIVSIRESWVFWGLDAFHEGETFLALPFMTDERYQFLKDFFPVHGLGRNILHSYYTIFFTDNNLYFSRISQALTYPFIHVLIAACLYRFSNLILVPICFFVLTYLFGLFEERDLSPFLLLAFLIVPLKSDDKRNFILQKWVTGLVLFLASIYSLEYFVFLNIVILVILVHWSFSRLKNAQSSNYPLILISFYLCTFLFFIWLGSSSLHWFEAIQNALNKSPNLLERPLEAPDKFSFIFFFISCFFAIFILFFITQVIFFLRSQSHRISSLELLVAIFSMLSLLFFVRAFNRSDIGHILYAFGVSLPIIISLSLYYRWCSPVFFSAVSLMLLMGFVIQGFVNKNLTIEVLRQRPNYDSRLSQKDVRPAQHFGNIVIPKGVIDNTHITNDELIGLDNLVKEGYKIFDLTNQPVLINGVINSPLVSNDMHTLFYNNYNEQQSVIKQLQLSKKVVILWSANHWSETLDSTYVEYRLPILTSFILKNYTKSYKIGKFILLSNSDLNFTVFKDFNLSYRKYNLGYSPSRMSQYKQEIFSDPISVSTIDPIKGLNPVAISIDLEATGGGDVVIKQMFNGAVISEIFFKAPKGKSKNFIRLNNIPNYYHAGSPMFEITASDPGTKIEKINFFNIAKTVSFKLRGLDVDFPF